MTDPAARAAAFRAQHDGPDILLLANAWDAGSARLIESLGAKAIATTSAGLAWAAGYPDGDVLPVPTLLAAVQAVARVNSVPLTVDVEAGYSDDPAEVGRTVAMLIEAGAVGINIEDAAGPPALLCTKIEAAKAAGREAGVDLFVNARIDVHLRVLVADPDEAFAETERRMLLYAEAGCDGVFVPGPDDPALIGALARAAPRPLNVLARPSTPDARTLKALGVRRLSAGSWISQAALETTRVAAREFLAEGRLTAPAGKPLTYPEINRLFA